MNRQQLLHRLARTHSVFYCTGATIRWDIGFADLIERPWLSKTTVFDGVNVDIPGVFPLRWPSVQVVDRFAVMRTAKRWARTVDKLDGDTRVLYIFHPDFWPYVEHLEYEKLIYHAYDHYGVTPSASTKRQEWERLLIRHSDLVVATTPHIAHHLSDLAPCDPMILPNGVDYPSFSTPTTAEPEDLGRIARPRVGYVGRVNQKVDLKLLGSLAQRFPDVNFVVVGPVSNLDEVTAADYEELQSQSNVYFLGEKSYQDLPQYVQNIDVGLMCYRSEGGGAWMHMAYPLKMHEYLAAGLPVVSSDIPSVREFQRVVRIASNDKEWKDCVAAALQDDSPAKKTERQRISARFSWDTIASDLERKIMST